MAAAAETRQAPRREVHCADALAWMEVQRVLEGCSIVTSLPDVSEVGARSLDAWRAWFRRAAELAIARTPDDGVTIFFQSDIKKGGVWIDKGYLCQRAAEEAGAALLWHKIVCRAPPNTITFGRAAWSHLLCFSRGVRHDLGRAPTPDVLPDAGAMTWVRAIGLHACRLACRYVREHTRSQTIVDPFCGQGTVLAVANELGFDAIGVELNRKRAARSRLLQLEGTCTG